MWERSILVISNDIGVLEKVIYEYCIQTDNLIIKIEEHCINIEALNNKNNWIAKDLETTKKTILIKDRNIYLLQDKLQSIEY